MQIKKVIELLEGAVRDPARLGEVIPQMQEIVWAAVAPSTPELEILRDLAYDLDYFEPNVTARSQDPSYLDSRAAITEITRALTRLQAVNRPGS